tara:strand:- start:886 stop:1374 length:489 start_codon:yes stop_codon:yes gene_type:complete
VKLDSLTFDKRKTYRRAFLSKLGTLFAYTEKPKSILALRREIVRKHLHIPKTNLRRFWQKESFLLKRLIDEYPDEDFWLKVNFKSIFIKVKTGASSSFMKEQKLFSFAQFFNYPFKDELIKKYQQSNYKVKEDNKVELSQEKSGEDVIIKRKPRSIKDFLNG